MPNSVELFVKSTEDHVGIYYWCQENNINYKTSVPFGRDWVYVYHFEDLESATWFQLVWGDLVITQT